MPFELRGLKVFQDARKVDLRLVIDVRILNSDDYVRRFALEAFFDSTEVFRDTEVQDVLDIEGLAYSPPRARPWERRQALKRRSKCSISP